jgi:hypothetical protein
MSFRNSLPAIDFKNEWLNKDRELYTLIFTKTSVGVVLNTINVVLGDETFEEASGRSLGVVFSGLLEMANVSGARLFLQLSKGGNYNIDRGLTKPNSDVTMAIITAYDVTFGALLSIIDYTLNSRFVHIPIPAIPPVAQIDNYIVNPLHAGMVRIFLPPEQVFGRPNTIPAQRILGGLSVINNVIGSIAVTAGIIATQFVET